jgi:two-component system cell cycle sensor histidine kinase/response regulator CckA
MGGLATLAALRALDPAVKAVVMSGYSQEAILHEHTQHGFRAALTKPFNLDDLHHTLARVIAQTRRNRRSPGPCETLRVAQ